ncbi:MAG: hypothetical protein ACTSQA_01485 [Candidatus Heimdallarchaeaceae archaeon]
MNQKKGISLSQGFAAVLVVIVVAVLIIVAVFLFVTLQGTFPNEAQSIVNETSASVVDELGVVVANASDCEFNSFVLGTVTNITDGTVIDPGNYSSTSEGVVACDGCIDYNSTSWNMSYIYNNRGAGCDASASMVTQFATYPALLGLVGMVVFLGLVIGVLVASFAFGGRSGI